MKEVPKPGFVSEEEQLRWFEDWWRYADRDQEGFEDDDESEDSDESDDQED